ncbi:hypothetical protein [Streptomyces sp. NPDC026659]|uniref:hypothetical protein n=1 Tax=Streptomyces sp. NPDC026659 TaxID=3155123 RepID=UPI00340ECA58
MPSSTELPPPLADEVGRCVRGLRYPPEPLPEESSSVLPYESSGSYVGTNPVTESSDEPPDESPDDPPDELVLS